MSKGFFGFFGFVFFMVIGAIIGCFAWPYTLNTWLVFVGKDPSIVCWQGALLGFCPIIGHLTIPACIITWILMLFIG
jgi:hypothetical protein